MLKEIVIFVFKPIFIADVQNSFNSLAKLAMFWWCKQKSTYIYSIHASALVNTEWNKNNQAFQEICVNIKI